MDKIAVAVLLIFGMFVSGNGFASSDSKIQIDTNVSYVAVQGLKIAYISDKGSKVRDANIYIYDLENKSKRQIYSLGDSYVRELVYKGSNILWWEASIGESDKKYLYWLSDSGEKKGKWEIADGFESATIWNGEVYILNSLADVKKLEIGKPMPFLDTSKLEYPERRMLGRKISFIDGPNNQLAFCNGPSGRKDDDWATFCYEIDEKGIKTELTKVYSLYRAFRQVESNYPVFCGDDIFWLGHARQKYELLHRKQAKKGEKLIKFKLMPSMLCHKNHFHLFAQNGETPEFLSEKKEIYTLHQAKISPNTGVWITQVGDEKSLVKVRDGAIFVDKIRDLSK